MAAPNAATENLEPTAVHTLPSSHRQHLQIQNTKDY
jgi:hypothetical protein